MARPRPTLKRLKAEYDGLPPEAKKDVPTFENWLALNQFVEELNQYLEDKERVLPSHGDVTFGHPGD